MRRLVTGVNAAGEAVFQCDDESPHRLQMGNFEMGETWFDPAPVISDGTADLAETKLGSVPEAGEVLVRYVVFPPQAEMDAMLQRNDMQESDLQENDLQENAAAGVSDNFHVEEDNPGMHTTETIDYGFVPEGSLVLELDNGAKRVLNQGDTYIQNGTRHAWYNETDKPAMIGVVMLGAKRQ